MANKIRLKRGDGAAVNAYTGPYGELVFNRDTKSIHIQDGVSAGGHSVSAGESLDVPVITSPLPGLEFTEMPIVTVGKATGKDVHLATQWQVATDIDFANVLYDTGSDENLKTAIDLSTLAVDWEGDTTYYVRARFYSGKLDSSNWSIPCNLLFAPVIGKTLLYSLDFESPAVSVEFHPSGERIAVGYYAATVNGLTGAGRVDIFDLVNGEWVKTKEFTAETPRTNYRFGATMYFSDDGNYLAVNYSYTGSRSGQFSVINLLSDTVNSYALSRNFEVGESFATCAVVGWSDSSRLFIADRQYDSRDLSAYGGTEPANTYYYGDRGKIWAVNINLNGNAVTVLDEELGVGQNTALGSWGQSNIYGTSVCLDRRTLLYSSRSDRVPSVTLPILSSEPVNSTYHDIALARNVNTIGVVSNFKLFINENITESAFTFDFSDRANYFNNGLSINDDGTLVLLGYRTVDNNEYVYRIVEKVDGVWTVGDEIPDDGSLFYSNRAGWVKQSNQIYTLISGVLSVYE